MIKFKREVDLKESKDRDRFYSRMDEHQRKLFHAIKDTTYVYCEAIAGSGKTTVSLAAMIDMLANGDIDKIVYIRIPDERLLRLGFLKGDLEEKTDKLWTPIYDAFTILGIQPEGVASLIDNELFLPTVDIGLRGCNLSKCGVIIDETQNASFADLKLVYTRIHDDCHIISIGDIKQKDNKRQDGAFTAYGNYLADSVLGTKCELVRNYRGKFSQMAELFEMEDK